MTTTTSRNLNTVIVGGGHAGVNLSCWLQHDDPHRDDYIILEKADTLLPQWKYARWENFQINTPVRFSKLYGEDVGDDETLDRHLSKDLERWEAHIQAMNLKYQLHATVQKVAKTNDDNGGHFTTTVVIKNPNDGTEETVTYVSKNVVCANGNYNFPKKVVDEDIANNHPEIKQHTPMGLKWSDLNPGGVLIVGGGQTGVQLADLLIGDDPQHQLHSPIVMCTSKINGSPRAYRGRDIFYWMEQCKFLFMPKEALKEMPPPQAEALRYGRNPVTGPNKPISPFSLYRKGVELLGGFERAAVEEPGQGCQVVIRANRAENIKACLDGYNMILGMICIDTATKMEQEGKTLNPPVPEVEWEIQSPDDEKLLQDNGPLVYNLSEKNITNIIWATGFGTNFDFLATIPEALEEFDKRTNLPDCVVSQAVPGLFFTGFPWVGNNQSSNIVNFDQDHKVIVEHLKAW